jgi:hypothetical protein
MIDTLVQIYFIGAIPAFLAVYGYTINVPMAKTYKNAHVVVSLIISMLIMVSWPIALPYYIGKIAAILLKGNK